MAVAALVLSVIAVVVAAASAWYARQQAHEVRRAANIDADRRADEVRDREAAELAAKQARLALHIRREWNEDGAIDESPYRHFLVVSNDGEVDARDVQIAIVSAWNNPLGTRACFDDGGEQRIRVGRVLAGEPTVMALRDDRGVDFGDIGECEVEWRDDSAAELQRIRLPARPNWTRSET